MFKYPNQNHEAYMGNVTVIGARAGERRLGGNILQRRVDRLAARR